MLFPHQTHIVFLGLSTLSISIISSFLKQTKMSINHISQDLQETTWWHSQYSPPQKLAAHHHHHHPCLMNYPYHSASAAAHSLHFNLKRGGDDDESSEVDEQAIDYNIREQEVPDLEKELLFEKPLTPSDVGKLNRLVIPKQHAEKYFPLGGESGDKVLLLSFEDESGKCWRFRYSYWSSSQSYVLTKGWSRYVKEKRLDAGDVVLFERHCLDMGRLFIGWKRRGEEGGASPQPRRWKGTTATTATTTGKRGLYPSYPSQPWDGPSTVTDCTYPGSAFQNHAAAATGNPKTLRLFGVNLECHPDESDPSTPDGSPLSSLGLSHQAVYSQSPSHYYPPNFHQMQDITFTQDVNYQQIRNRRG